MTSKAGDKPRNFDLRDAIGWSTSRQTRLAQGAMAAWRRAHPACCSATYWLRAQVPGQLRLMDC